MSRWPSLLHDIGEAKVKHGARIRVFNLYSTEIGNPNSPTKMAKPDSSAHDGGGEERVQTTSSPEAPREVLRRQPTPSEEGEILRAAAEAQGQIHWIGTDHNGFFINAGDKTFPPLNALNMYESKKARQKLDSLVKSGLIELMSRDPSGNERYELTLSGFEAVNRQ